MLRKDIFKGEEAIILENNLIKAIVLPELGGKIASIYYKNKNFELVFQNKDSIYKKPELYSAFEEFDAAGFDDAFPTIDKCKVKYNGKDLEYPDHGEIWSSSFNIKAVKDHEVELEYCSKILPYTFTKKISLDEKNHINIQYNISNLGEKDIPCIFAAHYLVNCEKNMEICFPEDTYEIVMVQDSIRFGQSGTYYNYKSKNVEKIFSRVQDENADNTEKYYVNHQVKQGRCSIKYHHKKVEYVLSYDSEKLPYLGFWVTEGGFRGDYNCALEPCNGFYDNIDIAGKNEKLYYLKGGDKLDFHIDIEINDI
ncbi:Galactose mutarotase [Hathewaya proteolytica DSM 3090]|uniref:Galactose mutarotase n=1 Tax=Hathewaya proteolytica DSM 3090 TaxID=1121331 RepID=A0A1M6KN93_9CLOT|nr:DUF5107 domain-containing protein [Hathewaya proteolytica]SHJ60390.1 Galactose mutarotase [Hathewaya proteolytica DSM 3090]